MSFFEDSDDEQRAPKPGLFDSDIDNDDDDILDLNGKNKENDDIENKQNNENKEDNDDDIEPIPNEVQIETLQSNDKKEDDVKKKEYPNKMRMKMEKKRKIIVIR